MEENGFTDKTINRRTTKTTLRPFSPMRLYCIPSLYTVSRVAQWKRAGPITQRSEDQNLALLSSRVLFLLSFFAIVIVVARLVLESVLGVCNKF